MLAEVARQVDELPPFGEAPLRIVALEPVLVTPGHYRLERKSPGDCLQDGEVRATCRLAGNLVDLDDDVGREVLGLGRPGVGKPAGAVGVVVEDLFRP